MSRFKSITVTTYTKVGFQVEMHIACRRYWPKGKRWAVDEYSIFGLEKTHNRISAADVRRIKESFIAKYN